MRIIFVGRLIYGKGVQDLIDACNGLWNTADFKLVIVGDGNYRPELEEKVRLSLSNSVEFTGEVPRFKVFELLRVSDIFVNPSYSEGLPTTVLEAASVGLPIIATDVGGTREIVTHGVSGLLYRPGDLRWLAVHLETLIKSSALRRKLGERAKEAVSGRFSWSVITRQYVDLLKEVVK